MWAGRADPAALGRGEPAGNRKRGEAPPDSGEAGRAGGWPAGLSLAGAAMWGGPGSPGGRGDGGGAAGAADSAPLRRRSRRPSAEPGARGGCGVRGES